LGHNFLLFVFAVAVAIGSWFLVQHYNKRMSEVRKTGTTLAKRLKSYGVDYDAVLETDVARSYSAGLDYDKQELNIFGVILGASPFLVLLQYVFG